MRRPEPAEPFIDLLFDRLAEGAAVFGLEGNVRHLDGDPGTVATSPSELAAAKASWETPEYGYFTGHNPATPGTAVNAPWQLDERLAELLPDLHRLLVPDGTGGTTVEWWVEERA